MPRTVHVIGNGDSSALYQNEPRKGLKLLCNKAPFEVPGAYASCIVDFKMTHFIHKGQVDVPGEWVMGVRPKEYMARNPQFHLQRSHQIKMFYTKKPKYAKKLSKELVKWSEGNAKPGISNKLDRESDWFDFYFN